MKILVINGVNLNMLGVRERGIYGEKSYKQLLSLIRGYCKQKKVKVDFFQSNYEGALVTKIQKAYKKYDGIIINAGAYSHTSIAILDALKSVNIKTVEVHISNTLQREEFRHFSYISLFASKVIMGNGFEGYLQAVDFLA